MQIQVTTAGSVSKGEYIAQVDDESYPLGSLVPAGDYDPEEQDWQHVIKVGGHADIGWMILAHHNGEQYRVDGDWSQHVWRYLDDEGEPVRQDPEA